MNNFVPSPEQQAIFDFFLNEKKNFAIDAVAGAGKTTVLVQMAKAATESNSVQRIVYCAFNKDIVKDVAPKLSGTKMEGKTFHSIGLYGYRKHVNAPQGDGVQVDEGKYRELIKAWAERSERLAFLIQLAVANVEEGKKREAKAKEIFKDTCKMFDNLLHFMRVKLVQWTDVPSLIDLIDCYQLDEQFIEPITELVCETVPEIMRQSENAATNLFKIDYTDMIYWPVYWNAKLFQYPLIMADECQDISPMQRKMIGMLVWRNGRVIAVGDKRQAIYAFTGADSDSFDLTVDYFNMEVLPMTVTRRCAKSISLHASEIVSHFKPLDDAPDGEIQYINEGELLKHAQPGDLIGCRITAPLVEACLDLIAAGRPATILGSNIGASLVEHLEKVIERADYTWETLPECIETYKDEIVERLVEKHKDPRPIQDTLKALRVIAENSKMPDVDSLREYIKGLFKSERTRDMIVFSTIHKLKGLEADRVFILKPEILPFIHPLQSAEQMLQEMNLTYVLRTRAKGLLVYLCNKDFPIPASELLKRQQKAATPLLEIPKMAAVTLLPVAEAPSNGNHDADTVDGEIVVEEPETNVLANLRKATAEITLDDDEEVRPQLHECEWCHDYVTQKADEPCKKCQQMGAYRATDGKARYRIPSITTSGEKAANGFKREAEKEAAKSTVIREQAQRRIGIKKKIDDMQDEQLVAIEQLLSIPTDKLTTFIEVLDLLKKVSA